MLPVTHLGVNPRGLIPSALWHMDVTHVPEFGQLKFPHVCVDTFSGFVLASKHRGEAVNNVIAHLLSCISILGLRSLIKADNEPAYCSHSLKSFCSKLKISFKTGIPYNPQCQGIMERANGILKHLFIKLKV